MTPGRPSHKQLTCHPMAAALGGSARALRLVADDGERFPTSVLPPLPDTGHVTRRLYDAVAGGSWDGAGPLAIIGPTPAASDPRAGLSHPYSVGGAV